MSEKTAKPYLVRALYEWCAEQGYTPYLVVKVTSRTRVPRAYVRDGQITLNISETAVHRLTMDNEWVLFNARFNGVSQEVAVPMDAVIGIYARETGYGMGFALPDEEEETQAPAGAAATGASPSGEPTDPPRDGSTGAQPASTNSAGTAPKPPRSRAHLSIVK